jgi:hypothetical protein
MERVCVGWREEAVSKSRLSLLEKSFRVEGAEGELEVRMRREWRRIWPVKLLGC